MPRTDEFVQALLRRYREYLAADCPADEATFAYAHSFGRLRLFASRPGDDRLLRAASLSIASLHRKMLKRPASLKTVTRVLSIIAETEST